MEESGSEWTSHPLLLTVYRLTGVPNIGGSAIVYTRYLYVSTCTYLPVRTEVHVSARVEWGSGGE
eukprot:SAG11_NODE_22174_length_410_cov_6.514469_1_plen_65_part_00